VFSDVLCTKFNAAHGPSADDAFSTQNCAEGCIVKIASTGLRGIPGVMGGIETHCEELYTRIVERDKMIDITVLGRSPYLSPGAATFKHVKVLPVWTVKNKYAETLLHTVLSIFKARFSGGYDGLHVHAIGPGLLVPLARLLGMQVIVTHHGSDYDRMKWGRVAKAALRLGEWLAVRFAHRTITVSQFTANSLKERFPSRAERIIHIPNGASLPTASGDQSRSDAALFEALGVEPQNYVLAVGRLVPEKAFDQLVEAHARSGTSRKLLIVGGADFDDTFSAALMAKASPNVIFAGVRPRSDLVALYREASVFVLPSFHEGLPIVALEAIHMGTPVLLSDIGPNMELGLNPAAYFPVGDIDAMARALSAPPVPVAADLSQKLRKRYDWDVIAEKTVDVFRTVYDAE
jgi:glycosyltransferase involved in cell wall biosynthesis